MDFHAQRLNFLLNLRRVEPNPSLEPTYVLLGFNKAGYLVKVVGQLISEVKDERISKAKALFRAI